MEAIARFVHARTHQRKGRRAANESGRDVFMLLSYCVV